MEPLSAAAVRRVFLAWRAMGCNLSAGVLQGIDGFSIQKLSASFICEAVVGSVPSRRVDAAQQQATFRNDAALRRRKLEAATLFRPLRQRFATGIGSARPHRFGGAK